MNEDTTSPLARLESFDFASVVGWLRRALAGLEALPLAVPGEPVDQAIVRASRSLSRPTGKLLVEACRQLVVEFVRSPEGSDEQLSALLWLAEGLGVEGLEQWLHPLASDPGAFGLLSAAQQETVVRVLVDLRAPLPDTFWAELATRGSARLAVLAFTALLPEEPQRAAAVLRGLPDDANLAHGVYAALAHRGQTLSHEARRGLAKTLLSHPESLRGEIAAAVRDWATEEAAGEEDTARKSRLGEALDLWAERRNERHVPRSRCARLCESHP